MPRAPPQVSCRLQRAEWRRALRPEHLMQVLQCVRLLTRDEALRRRLVEGGVLKVGARGGAAGVPWAGKGGGCKQGCCGGGRCSRGGRRARRGRAGAGLGEGHLGRAALRIVVCATGLRAPACRVQEVCGIFHAEACAHFSGSTTPFQVRGAHIHTHVGMEQREGYGGLQG